MPATDLRAARQALKQQQADEQRHSLVDLRGNRLRIGGGH